jgi:arylsulfatase
MGKTQYSHGSVVRRDRQAQRRCVAFVRLSLVWVTCLLVAAPSMGAEPRDASRPNIVLVMADDLGFAELGCYGQQKIKTPNIDAMAAEGMRFTQHYTSAPVCAPARCCLMTGRHAGHALVRDNAERHPPDYLFGDTFGGQYPLPADTVTMARVLQQAGYVTGAFGKWGLGGVGTSGDPLNQGFDRFFGYNCQRHAHNLYPTYLVDDRRQRMLPSNTAGLTGETYAPQQVADEMLAFVRAHRERPFFVYYPTVIPHLALQVPEAELAAYRGQWPETPYTGKSYQPHPTPRAAYAAMISFFDQQVGRLLSLLKELELDDRTIVLLTSDNGTTVRRRHSRPARCPLAGTYSAGYAE